MLLQTVEKTKPPTSLGRGKWLQLELVSFKDSAGTERTWERCVRSKPSSSAIDGMLRFCHVCMAD